MTQITVSDVLRGDAIMTFETLSAICRLHTFDGTDGARITSVFAQMHLTHGMLNAWLVLHCYRRIASDDIQDDEPTDTFSRVKMLPVLTRIINDIHRENNYVLATTVQQLLQEVAESMVSELCHGFIDLSRFTPEYLLSYDLNFYSD